MQTVPRRMIGPAANTVATVLLAIGALLATGPAYAADRNCTAAEKTAADAQLWLNTRDKKASVAKNLPWGTPESGASVSGEKLLVQRDYVTLYDEDLRDPIWVGYRLEFGKLGKADRINCFRRDERIDSQAASTPTDYKEPVFDQGHMAPNSDMSTSDVTVINSFVMSNMTPQYCQLNRGGPCGSGKVLRKCHRDQARLLRSVPTAMLLASARSIVQVIRLALRPSSNADEISPLGHANLEDRMTLTTQ